MNEVVYNVLKIIEDNGYKAYVVGGYVRDYIWSIESFDVDICTNASSDVVIKLFEEYKPKTFKYDSVKFKIDKYHFDISRIRCEKYIKGKTIITYTNNLYDDYNRRDFTFNALYMNRRGNIITFGDSYRDCKNREIVFIDSSFSKINEDPSRLLRYIYFVIKYDLKIDKIYFNKKTLRKYLKNKDNDYVINYYVIKIKNTDVNNNIESILNALDIKNELKRIF